MSTTAFTTPVEFLPGTPESALSREPFIDPDPTINLTEEATTELAPQTLDRRRTLGSQVLSVVGHAYEVVVSTVFGAGVFAGLELLRTDDEVHGEILIGALAASFLMRFIINSARQSRR